MPKEDALLSVIKRVGDDVYSHLPQEAAVVNRARDWLDTQGITRVDDPTRILSRLTAYDRLLKTTLFALYRIDGPELSPIDDPGRISSQIETARNVTKEAAFERYILDDVADSIDQAVFTPVLDVRHQLADADNPTEVIGKLFEQIVPQKARRKLGQFRTPNHIAELMARWSVQRGDDAVLDPGMGAGVLSARMYDVKQTLDEETSVEDMWGVDLSELSVVMTSTALKLVNGEGTPHFHRDDFMDTVAEGEASRLVQDDPRNLPKVDAIVSNPPFSRHHELNAKEKDKMNCIAEAEGSMSISKRAPVYHYFYVHASQFLSEGGRLSFITPSEWLETNYGEQLKEYLLDIFAIRGVVMHESDIKVFDGAVTTSCITFLEKGHDDDCTTTFVKLSEWPGQEAVLDAITGETTGDEGWGFINHVPQSELEPVGKWTRFTDEESVDSFPGLKSLGEIAEVKRGIATGKNDYFCLSQSQIEEHDLPEEYLARLIRRLNGMEYFDLRDEDWEIWRAADEAVYLLYLYNDNGEIISTVDDPAVSAYLQSGKENGAADGYLTQDRDPWYRVDRRDPPDVLFTYMSKKGFRFLENKAGVRSLNNLHNINFKKDYTDSQIRAILAYLNSSVSNEIVARSGRSYADNLKKVEPNELEGVPVIDPDELPDDDVATLERYFVDVCEVARTDEVPLEEAMIDLDEKVADILGIDDDRNPHH